MKVLTKVLCVGMMIAVVAGCASDVVYVPSLPTHAQSLYLDYQSQQDNKVFVVAIDPNGDFAVGYDYGKATKNEAYQSALAQCKANCEKYGVLTEPLVYAINDEVVYEKAVQKAQNK